MEISKSKSKSSQLVCEIIEWQKNNLPINVTSVSYKSGGVNPISYDTHIWTFQVEGGGFVHALLYRKNKELVRWATSNKTIEEVVFIAQQQFNHVKPEKKGVAA